MSQSIEDLIKVAEANEDQTVTTEGGDYEYTPPVAGKTVGRMIEYIELGKQKQKPYQGKAKPDAEKVRVTFELLSPTKNIKEIEVNGEKKKVAEYITVTVAKKFSEKASYKKLVNKLIYGRPITHIARCLGNAYIFNIIHNESEVNGVKKVYANIQDDNGWLIEPPKVEDAITGEVKNVNVPEHMNPLKIFLWDNPTKETWDSLYIDGTREVKNGDKTEQVSKNWLQEMILGASDYPGSKLQLMLGATTEKDLAVDEIMKSEQSKAEDLPADDVKTDDAAQFDALAELGLG